MEKEKKTGLNEVKEKLLWIIVSAFVAALVTTFTNYFLERINSVNALPEEMVEMRANIDKISKDIDVLKGDMEFVKDDLSSIHDEIDLMKGDISDLQEGNTNTNENHINIDINLSGKLSQYFEAIKIDCNHVDSPVYLSSPEWQGTDVIAIDKNSGKEYKASELAYEKILFPYTSNNREIFFYGQYNENNNWDGHCIINAYENNKLVFITEAEYADGKILSYQQVFAFNNASGKVWGVSERENEGDYNSGVTYTYFFDKDYIKDFTLNNVTADDILTVEDFRNNLTAILEGFYCGNTSNNHYNDETGNAYIVKYAKDGTVRTLYVGNFVNGAFNDYTGNAWYIVRDEELNTNYMYYKGKFENGNIVDNPTEKPENPVSLERIKEILNDAHLDLNLNWYITDPI